MADLGTIVVVLAVKAVVIYAIKVSRSASTSRGSAQVQPSGAPEPVTGPSLGRQLVGEECVQCSTSIVLDGEGKFCKTCKLPIHRACVRDHRATHVVRDQAYR